MPFRRRGAVQFGPALMLGFYFAVQSGGNFEVDYTVMDPDDKVLLEGINERQGDYIFTANKVCVTSDSLSRAHTRALRLTYRLVNTVSVSRMKRPFQINC